MLTTVSQRPIPAGPEPECVPRAPRTAASTTRRKQEFLWVAVSSVSELARASGQRC